MRRNVEALPHTANFLEILDFIENSRYHTYPVVGDAGELLGVIRYPSIRSAVFDPELGNLVMAEDLSVPADQLLQPEQSLDEALRLFEKSHDAIIPVVASFETPELVGLVERRDVVRVIKSRHASPKSPPADLADPNPDDPLPDRQR